MRILHLAAGNRWTGAAAPAFAEVEALREAGVEAHYAFVGGYKLEQKLRGVDYVHPIIQKSQNPVSFVSSVRALRELHQRIGFTHLHAHLTYDHWLAIAAADGSATLARTFHSRRVLRTDLFTKRLVRRTPLLFTVNEAFSDSPIFSGREVRFTPPPLALAQFTPEGPNARERVTQDENRPIIAVIGKIAPGRGFELALQSFAVMNQRRPELLLMIIGHGEHRPYLEQLSRDLGIDASVVWAGYQEVELALYYRAASLLLFTARGSDEGHRAVLEVMGCGVPPVIAPLEGASALAGPLAGVLIAPSGSPEAIAATALRALDAGARLRDAVVERSRAFGYPAAAQRLISAYG